jgi:hypothetical protein
MPAADGCASWVWQPGVLLRLLVTWRGGGAAAAMAGYRSDYRCPARTQDTLFCLSGSGRDRDAEMIPV